MFRSDRIIALDVGASKLVLAEFSTSRSGAPELLNYGVAELGAEPDSELDLSAYVVSTIRQLMRDHGIRQAPLLLSMSGQQVFPRYVKLPPVTRDKLLQIIQYEAEQNVPFPIDEVVWDYQLIGDLGAGEELNVMLVAVKIENVTRLTDGVQAAGLEPEIVDVAPMALYNAVRYNYPALEGCCMVLDIGARSSNLIFLGEDKIFSRSIPVAGNAITQEIQKEFEVPFAEAEALKIEHAFVGLGGVYAEADDEKAERISKIVRNVVTRLHAEVNRSINFYRSQQGGSPPVRVLLTGGSSIVPHMDTFFREKLNCQVEYLNPCQNVPVADGIDGDRIAGDLHMLGEVVGLALRRALTCPVEINLMPPGLVAKKVFRKRQPFFVLAAVGLVLIMLCWWAYFHRTQGMLNVRVEQVEALTEELRGVDGVLDGVKAAKAREAKRVADAVGVINLRTRWIEALEAVQACVLDGIWLTEIHPFVEANEIVSVSILGRGFVDKLQPRGDLSAIEHFREVLAAREEFSPETRITQLDVLGPDDFSQRFAISVVLREPIPVR